MAVGTKLTAISEYLFRRLFKVLFRYDVFISYARRDGKGYALKLKEQLTRLDFSCFLDYDELPAGNSLNRTLKRAIKKSATIIVVGTEGALNSRYVELEVGEFARTGRAIIPIDFEGSLANAPWPVVKERDLVWVDETKDALAKSAPSPPVADAIDKLFKYTRRNVRVRGQVIATAALFLLGAAISVVVIRQQVAAANVQKDAAEEAKGRAVQEKKNAEAATTRAKEQERLANASAEVADEQKREALKQTKIAETQTAEAQKQATIARAKAEEARQQQKVAERQQKLASSRELSANALSQLQTDPELSLVLAGKSAEAARTFEAEDALRRSLLESHVRAVAEGHAGEVTGASFTPDGEFAVVTGDDNITKVLRLSDGQTVAELPGQTKALWGPSFSPDGKFIVTTGDDKTARVWEWRSNRLMPELLRHPKAVTGARFSHDGAAVITTSDDNAARVWDAKTGRRISPILYGVNVHEYHSLRILTIKPLSPDGRYVFFVNAEAEEKQPGDAKAEGKESHSERGSLNGQREGKGSVWDVSAGRVMPGLEKLPHVLIAGINIEQKLMVTYRGHTKGNGPAELWDLNTGTVFASLREPNTGDVNGVVLSPDGRFVVTANSDNTACVWKVPEEREAPSAEKSGETDNTDKIVEAPHVLDKPVWVLSGHKGPVVSAAFSPDGRFILTASDDSTARVWDVKTGLEVSILRGHTQGVLSVAFSPDGRRMLTSGNDRVARVWDAGMGQNFIELGQKSDVVNARFSARSNLVLTTDERNQIASVWDARTGTSFAHTWPGHATALSPDGKLIVTANQEVPRVYDAATGGVRLKLSGQAGGEVLSAAYSPDGRFVATAGSDKVVRVRDIETGKTRELPVPIKDVTHLVFNAGDGGLLLMAGVNHAQVWEWKTERPAAVLPEFGGQLIFGSFSPDGLLVVGPSQNGAALWDARTGCRKKVSLPHQTSAYSAVFGPDRRSLLSVDAYSGRLWQLPGTLKCEGEEETLKESLVLDHEKTGSFPKLSALFSPDGQSIVLMGYQVPLVQVWDASARTMKFKLGDESTRTFGVAVSLDGKMIVTACEDGNARVWDARTGKLLRTLAGSPAVPLSAASFSSDSKLIATVSDPRFNLVTVWDANTGQRLVENLRGRTASFSPDGKSVLTVSGGDVARLAEVSAGRVTAELQGLTGTVTHLAFSDDGLRIVAATSDRRVGVWEAASGRNLARREYNGDITIVALSPDGKLVATTSKANWKTAAQLWDTRTNGVLTLAEDGVGNIALSPDGRFVMTSITGSGTDVTKVWDVAAGKEVKDLTGHFAAFSSDGKRMATVSSNTARIWDAGAWGMTTELRGQTGEIRAASFSPDGKFIVTTADRESVAVLWNAETGAVETELFGETSYGLKSAAFSPDGTSILLVGEDKRARLYTCVMCGGLDDLLGRARERFARHARQLTPDEQKKFSRQTSAGVAGARSSSLAAP